MKKTLADLPIGSKGRIAGFKKGVNQSRQRLISMGLTPNTFFQVIRVAPMGDPVEIMVREYNLSLRRDEAMAVLIEGE